MDPALAGITAYVSQDCTGMKYEPVVDKNRILGMMPKMTLLFRTTSLLLWDCGAAESGDMSLTVSLPQQTHRFQIYNLPV